MALIIIYFIHPPRSGNVLKREKNIFLIFKFDVPLKSAVLLSLCPIFRSLWIRCILLTVYYRETLAAAVTSTHSHKGHLFPISLGSLCVVHIVSIAVGLVSCDMLPHKPKAIFHLTVW